MLDPIGAVSYKINLSEILSKDIFWLQFASCFADETGILVIRAESWRCALPQPGFIATADRGYSEARGIVGGIPDALQAAQSAVIERVIGDALALSVCEIVDKGLSDTILLRGPAFPKTLGRLLSLRFPEHVTVAWITPLQPSSTSNDETDILLRRLVKSEIRLLAFQHEYLLTSFSYPENKPTHVVDFVDNGDSSQKRKRLVDLLGSELPAFNTRTTRYLDFAEFSAPISESIRYMMNSKRAPDWLLTKELPEFVQSARITARGGYMFPWRPENALTR
jgi:hypothetical protein